MGANEPLVFDLDIGDSGNIFDYSFERKPTNSINQSRSQPRVLDDYISH